MVGLLSQAGNQCSQLSKAQLHIVHSTPQPNFFSFPFFGGYEIINFSFFFNPKKRGCVQCARRNELTQCETTTELAAASFQAEVVIKGLVCQPSIRHPSFSSTL